MASGFKLAVIVGLGLAAYACAPVGEVAQVAEDTTPTTTVPSSANAAPGAFYVAVMSQASTKDPAAYKLVAAPQQAVDPTSVKFCFGTVANCAAGTGPTLAGVETAAGTDGATKVYLTEKFV
jgi:hypothetical protein